MTTVNNIKTNLGRRLLVPTLAVGVALSFAAYEFVKPARAAAPLPAAGALDDNSVGALLAVDKAMETVAARVTPAIVNVTVTSKASAHSDAAESGDDGSDDSQQFQSPFGGFGRQGRPQPQVVHGLGSGIVISPDGYIVTNNHVVTGATDIRVTMNDRRVLPAKLVGADKLTDLAVIKVNASNLASVHGAIQPSCIPARPFWPLAILWG